jgi:hypothetical protein
MEWLAAIGSIVGGMSQPAGPAVSGGGGITFGAFNAGGTQGDRGADWAAIAAVGAVALLALVIIRKAK